MEKNSLNLPINLESLFDALYTTYLQKNKDYDDSFFKTYKKWGIRGVIPRVEDKFLRVEALIKNEKNEVKGEGKIDSLLDLSCYAAMIAMFLINDELENLSGIELEEFKEYLKKMNIKF